MQKQIFYIILLFLIEMVSCTKPTEKQLKMLDVFPKQENTDSAFVFSLDTIRNLNHLESIICKEVLENKKTFVRTLNADVDLNFSSFFNCRGMISCLFQRNRIITITNKHDSIYVGYEQNKYPFTVENYQELLTKQFFNRGKDYRFSSSPKKVCTFIPIVGSYQDYKSILFHKKDLLRKLDTVSKAYYNFLKKFKKYDKIDSLKQVYPLNLSIPIPPPPPINKVPPPPTPEPFIIIEK